MQSDLSTQPAVFGSATSNGPPTVVEDVYEETSRGTWRRARFENGDRFAEFRSHLQIFGLPAVHITKGKSPETGKSAAARGIIAIGRKAFGVIAIGQVAWGIIAIGQLALGIVVGLGQLSTGIVAVGQGAISVLFAAGQLAVGSVAIGQFGIGTYVLAQFGVGDHVWDTRAVDPIARQFFRNLLP